MRKLNLRFMKNKLVLLHHRVLVISRLRFNILRRCTPPPHRSNKSRKIDLVPVFLELVILIPSQTCCNNYKLAVEEESPVQDEEETNKAVNEVVLSAVKVVDNNVYQVNIPHSSS